MKGNMEEEKAKSVFISCINGTVKVTVNKSTIKTSGKNKAWGYQHGVLPRLLWPLLVYEIPISTVETTI